MMMWAGDVSLADLWHPKRANERQLPTNPVGRRARLDDGSGAFLPVAVACNERPVRGMRTRSAAKAERPLSVQSRDLRGHAGQGARRADSRPSCPHPGTRRFDPFRTFGPAYQIESCAT